MSHQLPSSASSTREKILLAALEVFLELGFERANLEKVAAKAGVTKPTVYSHFGSKIGLLEAIADHQHQQALSQFSPSLKATGDVRSDLTAFGRSFLANVLHPNAIRMHRFAITEAMTHPELVAPLLSAGPEKLTEVLQRYLEAVTKAGKLRCKNSSLAAQQLMGLLIGMDFPSVVLSQKPPSDSEIKKRVTSAVDIFLKYYEPERDHES